MAFEIVLTQSALLDIDEYTQFIAKDSPSEAEKWKDSLEVRILSLDESPGRFPLIPEASRLKTPYRFFVHYSHRVIYRIDEAVEKVFVLLIYHLARKPITRRQVQ